MQGLMQDFGWIRRGTEERLQSQKNPSNYCNNIDLLHQFLGKQSDSSVHIQEFRIIKLMIRMHPCYIKNQIMSRVVEYKVKLIKSYRAIDCHIIIRD